MTDWAKHTAAIKATWDTLASAYNPTIVWADGVLDSLKGKNRIDQNEAAIAQEVGGELKSRIDAIDARRKEDKAPYLESGRAIDKAAKEVIADLNIRVEALRAVYGQYQRQQLEDRREAQRQETEAANQRAAEAEQDLKDARAKREAAETPEEVAEARNIEQAAGTKKIEAESESFAAEHARIDQKVEAPVSDNFKTITKKVQKFEVVDKTKLPPAYLIPNEVEIRRAVLRGEEIPGVRVWEETKTETRRRAS